MIKITFLGTTGSKPTKLRGMPSIALEIGNELILLDCGEGTQRQLLFAKINPQRIKHIFITHLHGDHFFGLPGLIWSLGLDLRKEDLHIYGPKGIKDFLNNLDKLIKGYRLYNLIIKEISEGKIYENKNFEIYCIRTKHSIESYAYKIKEKDKPPKILKEKLKELGIPESPLLKKLKQGVPITLKNGRIIKPEDVLGKPIKGKIIVYTGDTAPFDKLIEFSKGADVLIHEATFGDNEEVKAREYKHSTARDAARIAKKAGVKLLILSHIGVRYNEGKQLLLESKEEFENVILAHDLLTVII